MANLYDFITRELPQGYEMHVGDRGVRLSDGQRQRIGIAPALYHNPRVLLMDEASSALDNATKSVVMDSVCALGESKTFIIISHRRSTVCNFLLEGGRRGLHVFSPKSHAVMAQ